MGVSVGGRPFRKHCACCLIHWRVSVEHLVAECMWIAGFTHELCCYFIHSKWHLSQGYLEVLHVHQTWQRQGSHLIRQPCLEDLTHSG